jgi:ATP-dependent DNA helicase RecQ
MGSDPVALLRRHLGYPGFRPGQEELVRAVISGRDALGVLPTGGGKSVCYQVPALALGGLTLVITPLVSLMEDQVGRAEAAGLRAAHLSAGQPPTARMETLSRARGGCLDILFVAPERLELEAFRSVLAGVDVRLLAVDEAHCISEWGHDFRPAYRRIGALRPLLRCPTLALTATATPAVRDDVLASLALERPFTVVRSFDRPNLSWSVLPGGSLRERASETYRLLRRAPGCAVVYAPTRRAVERVRDGLAARGLNAEAYHAGLPGPERSRVQASFMEGRCRVVVATNAFGMGIDKPDVRTVVHVHLPGTLESYYQEAGRAGRDGQPARCVAFHARADRRLAASFVDRTHPPPRVLARVHGRLRRACDATGTLWLDGALDPRLAPLVAEWLEGTGAGAIAALERVGAMRPVQARGNLEGTGVAPGGSQCLKVGVRRRLDLAPAGRLRGRALDKVEAVQRYACGRGCRRRALLGYFGEDAPERCGSCDRCVPSTSMD